MTNESDFFAQADLGKALRSTYERKIMSTKTLRKRVALVAVAVLGSGLMSVTPAHAAVNAGLLAYINKSSTVDVGGGAGAVALSTGQAGVSYTANGAISNSVASLTVPASATIAFKVTAGNGGTWSDTTAARIKANGALVTTKSCTIATVTCTLADYTAPATAGTYNMELIMSGAATSYAVADVETISFTLVVSALSDFSAGRSTVYIADGAATGTATTNALGAEGVKTSGTQAANIKVSLKRGDDSAYDVGTAYAYMTGPGLLDMTADVTDLNGDTGTDVRSDSLASDAEFNIAVTGDGTSGVGTVHIYVILADGVTRVDLPSKSVTFYGAVAKLEVTQNLANVKYAGYTTGYTGTTPGATDVAAVVIKATDSAGNIVCGSTGITALSSDTSVLATSTVTEDDGTGDGSVGKCYYIGQITTGANAASGTKATLTYRILAEGSTTTYVTAPALTFTVASSTAAKVVLTTDKSSYAPGEQMKVTATLTDSSGNPVSDGNHASVLDAGLIASGAVQGLPTGTDIFTVAGKKTWTVYAPVTSGSFSITGTLSTGVGAGATITPASASVSDAATASAQAKTEAAIASLIAKINSLSKLIAKIQKKLGVK